MTAEEIRKSKMNNEQLGDAEVAETFKMVANFKRAIEILQLIPGAKDELYKDGEAFKEKYNIKSVDLIGVKQLSNEDEFTYISSLSEEEALEKVAYQAFRYRQFCLNKLAMRDKLFQIYNVPKNTKMKKWRQRQIERTKGFSGAGYSANVQIPVSYELTDGCSVGCPFCGIGAEKLKKIFTYDGENIELFKNVLSVMHGILGDAAGRGAMYLSCEPLDNRDYEKFLKDFLNEFNMLPQITTAVPLRDIDRMHKLLKQLNESKGTFYRFSVKSVQEAKDILENFSPDELLKVELLPQFEEAPGFQGFAKTGRERVREELLNASNPEKKVIPSICCLSGFVINFARKDIRLITPYPANEKYPEGEVTLFKTQFTDADDLEQKILSMIDDFMVSVLPSDKVLKPYDYFTIQDNIENVEGGAIISEVGYVRPLKGPFKGFRDVVELLFEGKYTKKEIAEILYRLKGIDIVETYFCLSTLFKNGIIDEFSWLNQD